jgi:hypothetical protein
MHAARIAAKRDFGCPMFRAVEVHSNSSTDTSAFRLAVASSRVQALSRRSATTKAVFGPSAPAENFTEAPFVVWTASQTSDSVIVVPVGRSRMVTLAGSDVVISSYRVADLASASHMGYW